MLRVKEIKKRREDQGLTLTEASRLAGMTTVQQWINIEKGLRPNIGAQTLYRVAKALKCRMEDLLDEK